MTITESRAANCLPEMGTPVVTRLDPKAMTSSFFVHPRHIEARRNAPGTYVGYVPGAGGDVWWIEHEDKTVGAYCFDEVFDPTP